MCFGGPWSANHGFLPKHVSADCTGILHKTMLQMKELVSLQMMLMQEATV